MSEFSLVELENNFMTKKCAFSIRRQSLYPSEASVLLDIDGRKICRGKCMRAAYYRALGYKETDPTSEDTMAKAKAGKWLENGIVEQAKEMGIWVANSVKFFDDKSFVSGEIDLIVKSLEDERKIGYEIKTYYWYFSKSNIEGSSVKRLKDGGYSE